MFSASEYILVECYFLKNELSIKEIKKTVRKQPTSVSLLFYTHHPAENTDSSHKNLL